jgi:hypothetical protein
MLPKGVTHRTALDHARKESEHVRQVFSAYQRQKRILGLYELFRGVEEIRCSKDTIDSIIEKQDLQQLELGGAALASKETITVKLTPEQAALEALLVRIFQGKTRCASEGKHPNEKRMTVLTLELREFPAKRSTRDTYFCNDPDYMRSAVTFHTHADEPNSGDFSRLDVQTCVRYCVPEILLFHVRHMSHLDDKYRTPKGNGARMIFPGMLGRVMNPTRYGSYEYILPV